jgi:1,2-diacylglycerol 3-beta-galactosyltransferase
MARPRILILSSRTGGGHGRVAQTLRNHLLTLEPGSEITVVDGLEQTDLGIRVDPARSFLTLTTTLIGVYNLGYRASNRLHTVTAVRRFIRQTYGRSLARIIREQAPDLIVSTHHFLSPGTVSIDPGSLPPFVMVVSDLGAPHRLWFDPQLHTVYVPTDEMVSYAELCMQSAPHRPRVEMLGFPIDSEPAEMHDPDPEHHGLLVIGGGAGTGFVDRIADILSRGLPRHRIVVVCGRNLRLERTIAAWQRENIEVHGFVDNVPELMAESDLVVTKAGPVTIMEAAAAGRPLIITSWVGMQERGNVDFVVDRGLGLYCELPRNLSDAVKQVYDRYAEFTAARLRDVEHGPDRIAASILEIWRNSVAGNAVPPVLS